MVEWIATVALALCVFSGLYALGNRLIPEAKGLIRIRRYFPPVVVTLEYRAESGVKSSRKVAVVKSMRHRDGRLYLLGFSGNRRDPRTFRIDRIIKVAGPDGEIVDLQDFLTDWLGIPLRLCPAHS